LFLDQPFEHLVDEGLLDLCQQKKIKIGVSFATVNKFKTQSEYFFLSWLTRPLPDYRARRYFEGH